MLNVGKPCETCIFGIIDESDRSKIIIHCMARDKYYIWGQCIPCEDRKEVKLNES